uniref:Uncharacterized protein n=1 Tax=Gouania willdenowi TaxID=441366 RepID=A0A8C5DU87_GOUWI
MIHPFSQVPELFKLPCCGLLRRVTCVHIIGPTTGLGAAARSWGTTRIEDIIYRALHLAVINGLALVGAKNECSAVEITPKTIQQRQSFTPHFLPLPLPIYITR